MISLQWLLIYSSSSYVDYVRWELTNRGFTNNDIRQHLAAHEHYEEVIMSRILPKQGSEKDWGAALQEAHRYIIHYSTVRLSLVTFLVTAMFTALLYGLPKDTVTITQDSVAIFTGGINWPAISVAILLYGSALALNRIFDKRRYMMERFAADLETVLNAKLRQPGEMLPRHTAREHHLDKIDPQDVNVIVNHGRMETLQQEYEKGFRAYLLWGKPTLNVYITWAFMLAFIGVVALVGFSSDDAFSFKRCLVSTQKRCTTILLEGAWGWTPETSPVKSHK